MVKKDIVNFNRVKIFFAQKGKIETNANKMVWNHTELSSEAFEIPINLNKL